MSNPIYVQKFVDEIAALMQEKERCALIDRASTKGDMMEMATSDFFHKYFPNRCAFGKGCVQDSFGNQSKEVDVVIIDNDSIPPIFHGSRTRDDRRVEGFFPVESLWYAIEVKTCLNNTELKKAIDNMSSVSMLKAIRRGPSRMLFAYGSDLTGSDIRKEFDRYKQADSNWNRDPSIHVICIIGKGYLFTQNLRRKKDNKDVLVWQYVEAQKNYFEVACCIGGMINTITGQQFGTYLFDESSIKVLDEVEL